MSDYFSKNPKQTAGRRPDANPWQQDPFAAYDDPAMNPSAAGPAPGATDGSAPPYPSPAPVQPDYSAWRRPASAPVPPMPAPEELRPSPAIPPHTSQPDADRPDFTAQPPAFDGGRPAYGVNAPSDFGVVSADRAAPVGGGFAVPVQPAPGSFAELGADAPTRIARPLGTQSVSKHKTVDHAAGPFAPRATEAPVPEAPAKANPVPESADRAPEGANRRRRASRTARYEEDAASLDETAVPQPDMGRLPIACDPFAAQPPAERPMPLFDPFKAGDSETAPHDEPDMTAAEPPRMPRRPAVPGERYSGARTAMPHHGMPLRREEIGRLPEDGRMPQSQPDAPPDLRGEKPDRIPEGRRQHPLSEMDDAREIRQIPEGRPLPPQAQRPVRTDAEGRPLPPQAQRPVRTDAEGRPLPPQAQRPVRADAEGRPLPTLGQRPQESPAGRAPQARSSQDDAYSARAGAEQDPHGRFRPQEDPGVSGRFLPPRSYGEEAPRASVTRQRYDFEDEPEEERPHRGGILIPLLVVLLVLGGLLAGIMLPDWSDMGGGLGTAMAKIKSSVGDVFVSVKGMIFPEEAGVKSFTVSPTSATAPVVLVFSVQASTPVTEIRILDEAGGELLSKTLTDADLLSGEVTKNSKYNIWTLRYTFETAYAGGFTAQSRKTDGTWDEGMALGQQVSIAPPAVVEPPVQDFEIDQTEGSVPLTVGFTMVTSHDVDAVQVVNNYGDVVAEVAMTDADAQVMEGEETRTWSLSTLVSDAYAGSYYAVYQTSAEPDFTQSDYFVDVTFTAADETADVELPLEDTQADGDLPAGSLSVVATDTATPTLAPSATPTPTEAPTSTPAPTAAPTPLPILSVAADDSAAPSALKLVTKTYEGTKIKENYERTEKVVINEPYQYAVWEQSGVLTFRGDPFRQNAAYGTVNLKTLKLTELWKVPVEGGIKAKSGTLTGVGWPGQAVIVKWPTQLRALLGIKDDFKAKQALKEAIVGAQNGKIYFLDLVTGEATRDPVDIDWPSNGAMSLETNASPMLAVGQHISVLAKKNIDNGLHLFNLLNNKELTLITGKDKLMRSNYSGFNGAPVFDKNTGTMVVGSENGLLYTVEPGDDFDHIVGTLKISPTIQKYSWLANKQKAKNTNVDGSVAMYGSYAYFGDQTGIVQCVDVNTLSAVWAVDTGDNVDATVALDMEDATTVALYTGNTIQNQGRSGVCTIRRLDALTGKEVWAFTVPDLTYTTEAVVGCEASPVVGQNKASNLVYFTVTAGAKNATVYALNKATGAVEWTLPLTSPTVSSPVAVYNDAGDGWIVQAEGSGLVHLIDALTGAEKASLQLEGKVEASPAVYRDVLVLSTTGADPSYIYGIKLE
ncbi:MAG: PQQ-binding-like beta-propeller repeat protein [Clostridiales bacterium]|nr:PQQ-binding-like beta-propeller repeat protein [Clostridiales bacterium]